MIIKQTYQALAWYVRWAEQGSNLRPHLCKRCALTN